MFIEGEVITTKSDNRDYRILANSFKDMTIYAQSLSRIDDGRPINIHWNNIVVDDYKESVIKEYIRRRKIDELFK